jgi:hypothetical protein
VRRVVAASGGKMKGRIGSEAEELGEEDAARVEAWLEDLVLRRMREHGGVELCRPAGGS